MTSKPFVLERTFDAPEEQATFDGSHAMLKQGWDRAFDNLDALLRTMQD